MATCIGKNKTSSCASTLMNCKACGHVGCCSDGCSNQAFKDFRCKKCGKSGVSEIFKK